MDYLLFSDKMCNVCSDVTISKFRFSIDSIWFLAQNDDFDSIQF